MAFVARTYEEIRDDMIAYVRMHTDLTDFEVGSVIRTIIEAAALEDDEQYFQMVNLLDSFRISTASGNSLEDRVAEYGIVLLQPESAMGNVIIRDTLLSTSTLKYNSASGAMSLYLMDTSTMPASSFNIRIGEGTTAVEDVAVTTNNTSNNSLALAAAAVNLHSAGDRVSVVTGATDKALTSGIRVQVPATGTTQSFVYNTVESGTIINGNYNSTPILAKAEAQGANGNVGTGKITEFAASPPFSGAGVTNEAMAGGRDLETYAQLRDRARKQIQSLSKVTKLAIQQAALGVADSVTGQRVVTASVIESFVSDEVVLYIDDGTGFSPDKINMATSNLNGPASAGDHHLVVDSAIAFAARGYIVLDSETIESTEILEYTAVDYTTNTLTLATVLLNDHLSDAHVFVVDMIEDNAEEGTNFFQLTSFPVVRNSYFIWYATDAGVELLSEGVDYTLNRGTGQIELIGSGAAGAAQLVAHYSYYTALVKQVQTVIDGDQTNPTAYPGVRAAGINVVVEVPSVRRVTVHVSVSAEPGTQESDIIPNVKEAIETYIGSLGIGENVVRAEIIRRAMNVSGVLDVSVIIPTANITVMESELARAVDSAGNSLVQVN